MVRPAVAGARSGRGRWLFFGTLVGSIALVAGSDSGADLSASRGFREAVTVAGIREHQAAFQSFSDADGGNRVAGSAPFVASRDYVIQRMEAAGYDVTVQPFEFVFNADATPQTLRREMPMPASYGDGSDFTTMTYS